MNLYKNKTVLITGASYGIGESFAIRLNSLGANLILTARSEDKLNALCSKMNNAIAIPGDLSDKKFHNELYQTVNKKGLKVDILINNAGFGYSGLFLDSTIDNYEEMLNVNIHAVMNLTHLFLPDMIKNKAIGVINISSLASFHPVPYFSIYAATKAFVTSFTVSLHDEYKETGLRFLAVCPGYTKTNFNKRAHMKETHISGYIMSSETVVEQSLKAFLKGKYILINGAINRFARFLLGALPRFLSLKIYKKVIIKGMEQKRW